jgi:Dolichyl-phosphate-mannose-protein mannosyltransferase
MAVHIRESKLERHLSEIYDFINSSSFPYLFVVLVCASLLSCLSTWIFASQNLHIAHFDAKGHLLVSRRIFDNLNPGFRQIGAFWLPLPHILYLPFVKNDWLYFSGLAGTPLSMLSFVGTIWIFFRLIETVFNRFAAFCCSILYLTNPNMLYLQTTPLTENLALLFMIGSVYLFVLFFLKNERKYLAFASLASVAGILTRYENWFVSACIGLLLIILSLKERRGFKNFVIDALVFGLSNLAAMALTFWINWYTTGHAYMDHSFKHTDFQPAQGSFFLAFMVVLYTVGNLISYDWTIFALIAAFILMRKRFRETPFLASLAILGPLLLYLFEYRDNHPTRIRYGLPFVPIAIYFLAYWPGRSRLITFLFLVWIGHIAWTSPFYKVGSSELMRESMRDSENLSLQQGLITYVQKHDDGKLILAAMGDIAPILYDLKLPVKRYVHEGAKPYWNDAVAYAHPEKIVGWVFMTQDDRVWAKLHDDPEFHKHFALIGRNGFLELYKLTPDTDYNIRSHRPHATRDKYPMGNVPGI